MKRIENNFVRTFCFLYLLGFNYVTIQQLKINNYKLVSRIT